MNIRKLCCFYASDIHLITMLLPYINERINKSTKVITILENDMSKSANKVINAIQGKKSDDLLSIDWKNKDFKYLYEADIENKLILINGNDDFIERANQIISERKEKCEILDCYELLQGKENLEKILDEHEKVVNTIGEKSPYEVFPGYKKIEKSFIV